MRLMRLDRPIGENFDPIALKDCTTFNFRIVAVILAVQLVDSFECRAWLSS